MGFLFTAAVLVTVGGVLALILGSPPIGRSFIDYIDLLHVYGIGMALLKKETGYVFTALERNNIPLARKKAVLCRGKRYPKP